MPENTSAVGGEDAPSFRRKWQLQVGVRVASMSSNQTGAIVRGTAGANGTSDRGTLSVINASSSGPMHSIEGVGVVMIITLNLRRCGGRGSSHFTWCCG